VNAGESWLSRHLRGHFLLFDRRPAPTFGADVAVRLLLTAILLEGVRLAAVRWLYPAAPLLLLLVALLALGLIAVPKIAGIRLSALGFRPWREWTTTEKSYFLQVAVMANVIFPVVLGGSVRWTVFVPYLFFGFYQELVYRGMVQRGLTNRWGTAMAILVANVLYTFGPLHWYYFASAPSVAWPMFAAIFAIGLFFGSLYARSGNLWIVAVFHAIGNAYIVSAVGS
jgi:membrane protease YdiL (CAAX protease family)